MLLLRQKALTLLLCLFIPCLQAVRFVTLSLPIPVYNPFTLLPCLLHTLSSVNTVLTMLFSQNKVSCHFCQPWSSRNSLVHSEVTLNVKNDSKWKLCLVYELTSLRVNKLFVAIMICVVCSVYNTPLFFMLRQQRN